MIDSWGTVHWFVLSFYGFATHIKTVYADGFQLLILKKDTIIGIIGGKCTERTHYINYVPIHLYCLCCTGEKMEMDTKTIRPHPPV